MGWAKFDDQFHRRRKIRGLSDAAWRLYSSAIIDCCAESSDGVIEGTFLRELLPHHHEDHIRELLSKSLLHDRPGCDSEHCLSSQSLPIADTDMYVVHDFSQWQITTDEWEARKAASEVGNHTRHHVNKKIRKEGCRLCFPLSSDSESQSESKGESL